MRNGEVVIIDEFTGRMMPGRRYSEGLHQALEAKEHQPIQPENQTLASITFQNYFRMYEKLAGMTGTALTEADEFMDIYNLDVVEVPTNLPMIRDDQDDEVYRTDAEKYRAIITLLEDCKVRGQPVLVGTTSIEKSESLAEMLRQGRLGAARLHRSERLRRALQRRRGRQEDQGLRHPQRALPRAGGLHRLPGRRAGRDHHRHQHGRPRHRHSARRQRRHAHPPGARRHRRIGAQRDKDPRAAEIREQVARLKETALKAGGLFVLGTERHESRRIDNQLRGRSGRQGDPGRSKFFLSLEDDLMRIFGSDKLDGMLTKLGLKENEAIVHPWINKALEKAQQKVEARNFDIRKNILKFDNVMNDQRKVIFDQRVEWMSDAVTAEVVSDMRHDVIEDLVTKHVPENAYPEQWDVAGLKEELTRVLSLDLPVDEWAKEEGIADEELLARITRRADEHMAAKVAQWGPDVLRYVEKSILLQTLDHLWREHLVMLEHLRQVIGLRGYGQRDPLNEYKAEAFNLFETMSQSLREGVTAQLMRVEIVQQQPDDSVPELPPMQASHVDPSTGEDELALAAGRRADAGARRHHAEARGRAQSERSVDLGQGRPQRGVPVRLGQEVQALPRPVTLKRVWRRDSNKKSPGSWPGDFRFRSRDRSSGSPTSGCRSCRSAPPARRRSSPCWPGVGAAAGAAAPAPARCRSLRFGGLDRLRPRPGLARIAPCEATRGRLGRGLGFGAGFGAASAVLASLSCRAGRPAAPCDRCVPSLFVGGLGFGRSSTRTGCRTGCRRSTSRPVRGRGVGDRHRGRRRPRRECGDGAARDAGASASSGMRGGRTVAGMVPGAVVTRTGRLPAARRRAGSSSRPRRTPDACRRRRWS